MPKIQNLVYDQGQGEDKNWLITEQVFSARHLGKCEAIFTQGNGYLGQRAALEEKYVGEKRDLFVTGTFNKFDEHEVTELPNLPDVTNINIKIDGERFTLTKGVIHSYSRSLNLRTGELQRSVLWESPAGKKIEFKAVRFVSLVNEHITAAKLTLKTLDDNVKVEIDSGIDGTVTNTGSQHFSEGEMRLFDNKYLQMCSQTTESKVYCGVNSTHRFFKNDEELSLNVLPVIERRYLGINTSLALTKGDTLTLEKISAINTSRDLAYLELAEVTAELVKSDGLALLKGAADLGYDKLFQESKAAWLALWSEIDIKLDSSRDYDQLALRFALYHLNIMVKKDDNRVGIGAKALSGEGYKGHSFWDTEIFILPYFIFSEPEVARTLLEYRYKNLYGARQKARENGYEGAMYPWESAWIDDGEVTPLYGAANIVTGEPEKILTGQLEVHISADIAFAVWQYFQVTGDQDFMNRYGYEMIIDTARFWASMVQWDADKAAYVINDVIGPDEYKEHVNNNTYTNYMVWNNLKLALEIIATLKIQQPELYEQLDKQLSLDKSAEKIESVYNKLYLPEANAEGVLPQFEGYFDLDEIDITEYKEHEKVGMIFNYYNLAQVNKLQVSKQSDVVMLLFLLGELFPEEVRRNSFYYHEAHTLHDSSLSMSTHSVLASWLGDEEMAYKLFQDACNIDLGPVMTTSNAGIHSASMGGIWQGAVYGFGGLHLAGGELLLAPQLPEAWNALEYRFYWQNCPIEVKVSKSELKLLNKGDKAVKIKVYGEEEILEPGKELVAATV